MKLTRENYEFLLFELLEGNLDSQKADDVRRQIEKDPFLQEEWKLMQQTVLHDEHIVFRNKKALMKSEGPRLIAFVPLVKYAAAAVLVLSVWAGLQYYKTPGRDVAINVPATHPKAKALTGEAGELRQDHTKQNDDASTVHTGTTANRHTGEPVETTRLSNSISVKSIKNKNNITGINIDFVESVAIKTLGRIAETAEVPVEIPAPVAMVNNVIPNTVPATDEDGSNGSLREWMNRGIAELMGPFSHPKLRISRADETESKLAFNILFTSAEYASSTVVQIKK